MNNNNSDGGFGQGQFPTYGNEPPNAQPYQAQAAPSFEQMNQEFMQSQGQQQPHQQQQQQQPYQQQQPQQYQEQGFGQPQDQGFGQPAHTPPQGWGTQAPTDPFGLSSAPSPFGQEANPYGGQSSYNEDADIKWWQKGARVFLIGGAGILLLAILVFVIATNINNRADSPPKTNNQQVDMPLDQPVVEHPVDPPVVQPQQPQQPYVQQPDPADWQAVGDTEGFNFVETRLGEFIVKDHKLYFKNDGGMQVRSAVTGTLEGYPGTYEVDLPRTAVLFDKVTLGYKFKVSFDVYKAADSASIFVENIRPDK